MTKPLLLKPGVPKPPNNPCYLCSACAVVMAMVHASPGISRWITSASPDSLPARSQVWTLLLLPEAGFVGFNIFALTLVCCVKMCSFGTPIDLKAPHGVVVGPEPPGSAEFEPHAPLGTVSKSLLFCCCGLAEDYLVGGTNGGDPAAPPC